MVGLFRLPDFSIGNGTYIQRGYLISHSELHLRLSDLALKLSKNAVPGLSSSTRDLTKLAGRRVFVSCRQSIVEENGLITALEGGKIDFTIKLITFFRNPNLPK